MRRRDFIKVVAGSVAVWPLAVRAQQAGKQPTIGFLGSNEFGLEFVDCCFCAADA